MTCRAGLYGFELPAQGVALLCQVAHPLAFGIAVCEHKIQHAPGVGMVLSLLA